jgi:hypothetical protein
MAEVIRADHAVIGLAKETIGNRDCLVIAQGPGLLVVDLLSGTERGEA